MGRPRKWASDAERMAATRDKRTVKVPSCSDTPVNEQNETSKRTHKRTGIVWHPEISQDRFKGVGRGVPVDGYVLVSLKSEPNGNTEQAVVSESAWRDRLEQRCAHNLHGWSCKPCLPAHAAA